MLPEYLNAIRAAGGIPVVLPLVAEGEDVARLAASFDGFLFTGGMCLPPCTENLTGRDFPCPVRKGMPWKRPFFRKS